MANGSSPQYRLGSRGDLSFPDAMVYEKKKKEQREESILLGL